MTLARLLYPSSRGKPGRPFWMVVWALAISPIWMIAGAQAAGPVVVASKIDTEGALLGNMVAEMLQSRGIPVERRIQLGPTNIVRAALLAGQIDLYPEYTGNGALFFHRETDPAWKKADQGYAQVKALDGSQNRVVWLAPAPANNTWSSLSVAILPAFRKAAASTTWSRICARAAGSSSPP